ncbi:hypothetical protein TSTA_033980 [Talaromyces stipitatus ATCC 10500]|uniref:Uncharacterized protein n=1 Tax=Talaromyces stipitatus (strain ATCC 10500 / CBS 375.48 / QM 6759 / NRRL 1006) TaxID=441959 RepID=B8M6T9_TALSN|nr:uncharacterized protein TSTA_033980 [Talaromyces stipitatus ATCC 10500]EED20159.1 hypothetical protein TSTA_033980 [Talaromyces stipitatus ATCC 10500]
MAAKKSFWTPQSHHSPKVAGLHSVEDSGAQSPSRSQSQGLTSEQKEDTAAKEATVTSPTTEMSEKDKAAHDASKEASLNIRRHFLAESSWTTSEEQQVATLPRTEAASDSAAPDVSKEES